jgi:hypothetical protein
MAFTNYKSIADVLKSFSLNYQERDFVDNTEFKCDEYFAARLNVVIQEGIVFNSEYAICENIISPILTEIWREYIQNFLIWLWEFGVLQEEMFTKNRKYYVLDNLEELMGAVNFLFAESATQL